MSGYNGHADAVNVRLNHPDRAASEDDVGP